MLTRKSTNIKKQFYKLLALVLSCAHSEVYCRANNNQQSQQCRQTTKTTGPEVATVLKYKLTVEIKERK